jgi:2,3-bisphosphoglycerate-independent phosphoglycerate mutase
MGKKVLLMILDGWGITQNPEVSAIAQANTPFIDKLLRDYPHAELYTSGENVGLPDGQMGNSEVGHMNLGAGRIVYQDLVKINKAIQDGSFFENPVLKQTFEYARKNGKSVHFLGLLSDGGVHSHINHLKALIDMAKKYNVPAYIHAFMDGRDVDPHSGIDFLKEIQDYIKDSPVKIASVIGRYYAMDRDNRWERIKKAYDLLVKGQGKPVKDVIKAVEQSYDEGITDEFILPIVHVDENNRPVGIINDGDAVIFYNFRTDRGRELTNVLTQNDMPDYEMKTLPLHYVTMTIYDDKFKGIEVAYPKEDLKNTLGELVSKAGKKQIRIAETEKYPHVTFFFSGGKEKEFPGEKRILIPSPKVATYDLQPEMSANEVTEALLPEIKNETADLIVLNYANGDMVGHTGNFEAAKKAAETVDKNVEKVVTTALDHGYTVIILADHGNAENMINPDGSPNTAHTTNPVPVILVDKDFKPEIKNGILANIAPTILKIMGLPKPAEMTGAIY